jgi:excinuclease UvrABC nuclease subunit
MEPRPVNYKVSVTVSATGAAVVVQNAEGEVLREERYTARELALVRFAVGGREEDARERLATFTIQQVLARRQRQGQARREALERRLQEAIEEEDYELAARLRDQLQALTDEGQEAGG